MKVPIEFTSEERFLISYYQSPSLSSPARSLSRDLALLIASIVFLVLHLTREDVAWGLVACGILAYRIAWGGWQSRCWVIALRGIITKYERRLEELESNETAKSV